MKGADVIIVGGGIIGIATAYYLAKKGIQVTLLESGDMAGAASSRNGGGIRQSARDIRELPLAIHAVNNLWPNLSQELGVDVEYVQQGNLRLGKTEAHRKILSELAAQGRDQGLKLDLLDRKEVVAICPHVSEDVQVASFCPTDGHGNPMKTSLAYYKRARELGVEFISNESVRGIVLKKGHVHGVYTDTASYQGEVVLVAAGIDSRPILNTVGIDVPMKGIVTETLVTDQQPPMFMQMIGTAAADFYGHQTAHGSFVFGGMNGLEAYSSNMEGWPNSAVTVPHICRAILGYFPSLAKANVVRTWGGVIDDTVDHVPVLGRIDEIPGLFAACGFSGHGYGIAPAVGEQLAELIVNGRPSISLEAFHYDRFRTV